MNEHQCATEGCEGYRDHPGDHYWKRPLVRRPRQRLSLEERLERHTDKSGDHWLWTGSTATAGYGRIRLSRTEQILAHRASYEVYVGPIPEGMTIDHLCRVRACVRPDHLEVVTMRVNVLRGNGATAQHARQTHCKRGHPLTAEHIYPNQGARRCKTCVDEHLAERYRTDPEYRQHKIEVSRAWRAARR